MFFKSLPSVSWAEIKSSDTVIDVREPFEYRAFHAPHTKNIPLGSIHTYTPNGRIYVVCASGSRSKRAVRILRKQGFDAINIRGGMSGYGR